MFKRCDDPFDKSMRPRMGKSWNRVVEDEGSGSKRTYLWGMDLSGTMQGAGGVGGLLRVRDSGQKYEVAYDGNGNVSEYLSVSGEVVGHYEYDAFGRVVERRGVMSGVLRHGFSTKQRDEETGWSDYGYRYYAPEWGRWLSRDPIGEEGGVNLYGFVGNDGINFFDYLGLEKSCKVKNLEIITPDPKDGNKKVEVEDDGKIQPTNMNPGGLANFQVIAEFEEPDCGCCEVRQEVKWTDGHAPDNLAFNGMKPNAFHEDRDRFGGRYGHRDRPGQKGDAYYSKNKNGNGLYPDQQNGSIYHSKDRPTKKASGGTWTFKVKVIDSCNDDAVVEEKEFSIDWQ